MREQTTITVGVAIVLNEVSRMLLYKQTTNENGQPVIVDRDLPFRLKYRLNKNRMMLEADVKRFNQSRMIALARYGEQTPDGENVVITDPEKKEAFKKEISDLVDSKVTHSLILLEAEDLDLVTDTDMPISPEALSIFTAYMVDDPDLKKDIELGVKFTDYEAPVQEEPTKVEEVKEETKPIEEVKSVSKKKTTTKKTTKKTTTEEKVETEPKKTTAKKASTKKKKEEVNG